MREKTIEQKLVSEVKKSAHSLMGCPTEWYFYQVGILVWWKLRLREKSQDHYRHPGIGCYSI